MKIGITGWKGFIGSYLVKKLDNPILFLGNSRDLGYVQDFVTSCDRIYHLAGRNRGTKGSILANNLVSTGNLVSACLNAKTQPEVILSSSTQALNLESEYGFSKSTEEKMVKTLDHWCIFIIPNVYGPGCKPFYNSVVATLCHQIIQGEKPTIKDTSREFVFIDYLVNCLLEPMFNDIIYVRGEILSIRMVYEYLTSRLGEHKNLKKCLDYYKKEKNGLQTT